MTATRNPTEATIRAILLPHIGKLDTLAAARLLEDAWQAVMAGASEEDGDWDLLQDAAAAIEESVANLAVWREDEDHPLNSYGPADGPVSEQARRDYLSHGVAL